MSTLTSLILSGKRKLFKAHTQPSGAEDEQKRRRLQKEMRPHATQGTMSALGRPDREVSHDPMRPYGETEELSERNALGRPDREISHDPMRP